MRENLRPRKQFTMKTRESSFLNHPQFSREIVSLKPFEFLGSLQVCIYFSQSRISLGLNLFHIIGQVFGRLLDDGGSDDTSEDQLFSSTYRNTKSNQEAGWDQVMKLCYMVCLSLVLCT